MMPGRIYIIVTLVLFISFSAVHAQKKTIDSLLLVLRTLPDDTSRAKTLIELSFGYGEVDINKMIETAREALECSKKNNFEKGISQAYGLLGAGYSSAGNNSLAVEFLLKSVRISEKKNDLPEMAMSYHDIGCAYIDERKFEEGIRYFQKAVAIWKQIGNKKGPVTALYNIGHAYQEQDKDSIALRYYNQAIRQGREIGHNYILANAMINMSNIYLKNKDYTVAHEFIEKALELATEEDFKDITPEIYGGISEIYLAEGMSQKALLMAEKGLALAKEVHVKLYTLQSYKRLANIYHVIGNPSKAYYFLSSYTALNDTLKKEDRASIEQMIHSYELETKDLQLAAQTQQYQSGIFRRNALIGSLIGLLLLVISIYILIHNRTKVILASKQRQLKYYTQSLLEKSAIISSISEELDALKNSTTTPDDNMEKFSRILHLKIHTDEEWENFKKAFEEVYPNFFNNLRYKYPTITASELRLAAITKLNLSIKEAATMLGISVESVKQSRYRLKKRMEVPDDSTLKNFL